MKHGFTLIETILTITLLSLLASVVTPAIRRLTPPDPSDPMTMIADSTGAAMARGAPVTIGFTINNEAAAATIFPDGSVVADTALHLNRLTGRPVHAR